MALKVKQSLTIGDERVETSEAFDGITVYKSLSGPADGLRLFFVKDGTVIQILDVEADMGQGTGFVSGFSFSTPKE